MTSFVDRLTEAATTRQRGVDIKKAYVNRDDLQELLARFLQLDEDARLRQLTRANCDHQWVTLNDCHLVDGCPKCGEQRA